MRARFDLLAARPTEGGLHDDLFAERVCPDRGGVHVESGHTYVRRRGIVWPPRKCG